jgi:hypothetical protein
MLVMRKRGSSFTMDLLNEKLLTRLNVVWPGCLVLFAARDRCTSICGALKEICVISMLAIQHCENENQH